jgi:hypothetical protein
MVDDEDLNRSLLRFQFEAELLLQCCEDRRSGIVCRGWARIWCPLKLESEIPLESSLIHHRAS